MSRDSTVNQHSTTPSVQIGVGDLQIGRRERAYLNEVLDSNRLSYGSFTQSFERAFADLHNCGHALFCSSGTSALMLAVAALKETHGWQDGDEILVPATTFVATANVVLHNGMKPIFVDVDPRTYNMDPSLIEERITPRTRAILPVHLMGLPADMDPILDIASRCELRVIEDSCETMFASYRGRSVGSIGDVGCFSTYVAHFIVAGIGGFATTNDPDLAVVMKSMMNHGRDAIYISIDDDKDIAEEQLAEVVAKRFSFVRLGHNFRATEMEAAIGLAQLEDRDYIIKTRQANAHYYIEALADLEDHLQLPFVPEDRDHMFMLFPLVVKGGQKEPLVNFLESNGIETRPLMPVINQPFYVDLYGDLESKYPVARFLNQSGFYIGCHQGLSQEQQEFVAETMRRYFRDH